MGVEQALTLARTALLCTPKTLTPSTLTLSLSLNPRPHPYPLRLRTLTLKSSISDYTSTNTYNSNGSTGNGYYTSAEYERPAEIQWKKELCNNVQLIGVVATPVQIKQLAGGKAVAWSRLAVKKSAADTSWINLTFWDELAHVAWQHIEKGNQIYVSGRLVSDTVESEDGKQQTYYKVVVQQLNFIERSFPSVSLYDGEPGSEITGRKNLTVNTTGSTQELWQAFFANPVDWWDNRKDKRNPKYPDFKHKDTGEALWIEGRNNPSWVKSQLAILDSKMEAHQQNNGTNTNFFTSF